MLRKLGQAPTVSAFSSCASLLFTFLFFCFQVLQEQNLYQQRHILMRWWHYGMWWQKISCNLTCLEVLRRIALNSFLNLPWLEEDHRYQILAPIIIVKSYLCLNIIWNYIFVNQPYVHCSNEFFKSHGLVHIQMLICA